MTAGPSPAAPIFTAGHSTRSLEDLVGLLQGAGLEALVDVRRYPSSRRHPHFNRKPLADALEAAGMAYRHSEILGGRREPAAPDSPNTAWSSEGFRAYADHLATPEARSALEALAAGAGNRRICLMCAEKDPERCHRQLLADALSLRGIPVRHLVEPDRTVDHGPHPAATLTAEGVVIYPAGTASQGDLFDSGA